MPRSRSSSSSRVYTMSSVDASNRIKTILRKINTEDLVALMGYLDTQTHTAINSRLERLIEDIQCAYDDHIANFDGELRSEQALNDTLLREAASEHMYKREELEDRKLEQLHMYDVKFNKDLKQCQDKFRKTLKAAHTEHAREIEQLCSDHHENKFSIEHLFNAQIQQAAVASEQMMAQQRKTFSRFQQQLAKRKDKAQQTIYDGGDGMRADTTTMIASAFKGLVLQTTDDESATTASVGESVVSEAIDSDRLSCHPWSDIDLTGWRDIEDAWPAPPPDNFSTYSGGHQAGQSHDWDMPSFRTPSTSSSESIDRAEDVIVGPVIPKQSLDSRAMFSRLNKGSMKKDGRALRGKKDRQARKRQPHRYHVEDCGSPNSSGIEMAEHHKMHKMECRW